MSQEADAEAASSGETNEKSQKPTTVRNRKSSKVTSNTIHPETSDPVDLEPEAHGCCGYLTIVFSGLFFLLLFPILIWFSFTVIQSYERGVQLRLGKLRKHKGSLVMGSGIRFILPCVDRVIKVDMRTTTVNIPPQEVLTKDAVTIAVDAIVYMRVLEPASAVLRIENWKNSSQLLAVSMLRMVLGNYKLSELLSSRETIDVELRKRLDAATDPWGIQVERVEIKDVTLPPDMQRAMAAEAQASRAANAKVIEAKGEMDSAQMLQEAAKTMSAAPAALQLRYLQTLTTIAAEKNSTIVFPLPLELFNLIKK
ncbi:Erythrocyte band 7 integral membrane protein stomatin [Paragonimus heterotremus]|uniref:Erythrocyte band 7 integral membrane protein stomatin n=1 Tax=Paragonimus heterotremus TaxID=100268 RepID=A0A8J4X0S8_9TREM|nr:Erythrocyte band 7 integral membrane protein stomatin [Paragonimus heterotremus]